MKQEAQVLTERMYDMEQLSASLRNVSGYATGVGGAGYIRLGLTLFGEKIIDTGWESNGCPAAHRAANGLADFLKGRTLEQASKIEPDDLLILIGGLPDGKGHYAKIAVDALTSALQHLGMQASPQAETDDPTFPDNYLI